MGSIVGTSTSDDAGVYRLSDERALVQTVDFFTPVVDDAYDWGRIAAANALSDVYAMGGTPLTALQMVGWPRGVIPFEVLGDVIRGGADVMAAAGCTIVGGHSIDDADHANVFAQPLNTRNQTADSSNVKLNLDTRLRGGVQCVDHLFVG